MGSALDQLQASALRVARGLPDADALVLVASGKPALHDTVIADLAGLGYPNHRRALESCPPAIEVLSRMAQYPRVRRQRLPLDLATLTLLVDRREPVVALEASASAEFSVLSALGTSVVQALQESQLTANLVVAGDLSAGLHDGAPLGERQGAAAWNARVVELFSDGAAEGLDTLGPHAAAQVGARGWAPLCVLHGAAMSADLRLAVRRYAAPRGAGYLVMTAR
jgi:aromatic ring-opening dioxygenase LigB subunit